MRWVFGFLMVCYFLLGAMVAWEAQMVAGERYRARKDVVSVSTLKGLQSSTIRMQTFLEKYGLTGEKVWMERYSVEKDMARGLLQTATSGDRALGISPILDASDAAKLSENWSKYLVLADSAMVSTDARQAELFIARAGLRQEEMSLLLDGRVSEIISSRHTSITLPLLALGVSMLLVLAALLTFIRMVVLPARRLASEAKRLAYGDLDAPVTMKAPGRLGKIADALEELRANLLETREQMKRIIANGPGRRSE